MEPWGNDSQNRPILLNSVSFCRSETTSDYRKMSHIERPDPGNPKRPFFSCFFPAVHREIALRWCHDKVGHLSLEFWTSCVTGSIGPTWLLRQRSTLDKCCPCLTFKAKQPKAPLENTVVTHPLQLIHLDYLCLEPCKGQEENVLVVTDHFTWYAQAYVTWSQTTQTTAKVLWDNFIVHYGLPQKILSDQGRISGVSWWLISVSKVMGTQKLQLIPYHPD